MDQTAMSVAVRAQIWVSRAPLQTSAVPAWGCTATFPLAVSRPAGLVPARCGPDSCGLGPRPTSSVSVSPARCGRCE